MSSITISPRAAPPLAVLLLAGLAPASLAAQVTPAAWTQLAPATAPSARVAHGLAYHGSSQRVVLFGGCLGEQCSGETWLFDGASWTPAAVTGPSPRYGHAMAYDALRDRVVLFGGGDVARNLLGDTWEWDGTSWARRATTGPAPRWNHGMAYDPLRRRTVLYGGNTAVSSFGDTWEWDGAQWVRSFPPTSPPGLMAPAMAWDGTTGRVILFGGYEFGGTSFVTSDTWAWDGQDWQLVVESAVAHRYAAGMAWDESRRCVVMFGGIGVFPVWPQFWSYTDEWHGGPDWETKAVSVPTARGWTSLAYDAARGQVVMFGGVDASTTLADTWVYRPANPALFNPYGAGCTGSAGLVGLSGELGSRPWSGQTLLGRVSGVPAGRPVVLGVGASRTVWLSVPLPVSLGALAPGCSVLSSLDIVVPLPPAAGVAPWAVPIPSSAALIGRSFYLQALIGDPVNPLGLTLSNGGAATIGPR